MEDKDLFKLKIKELIGVCSEIGNLAEKYDKGLADLLRQKSAAEQAVFTAREEYKKLIQQSGAYREEFDANKKSELAGLELQRKEAKQLTELAQEKMSQAEKILLKADDKQKLVDDKMKEVDELKNELLQRREKVKALVSQI